MKKQEGGKDREREIEGRKTSREHKATFRPQPWVQPSQGRKLQWPLGALTSTSEQASAGRQAEWLRCPVNQLVPGKEHLQLGIQSLPAKLLQFCLTLPNPTDSSPPDSSVHGISRQEYWSGLPCPLPGDLLVPGINPLSRPRSQSSVSCITGRFFTTEPPEKPTGIQRSPLFSAFKVFLQKYANKLQLTKM